MRQELEQLKPIESVGTYSCFQHREWSGEYRFLFKTEKPMEAPPINSGDRVSYELTQNAARKLSESAEYVALEKGGYKTFLTMTFDNEARARMSRQYSAGEYWKINKNSLPSVYADNNERTIKGSNIQKELKRFFDGLKKKVERGFYIHYRRKYKTIIHYPDGPAEFVRIKFNREKIPGISKDELCYCWVAENPPQKDKHGNEIIDKQTGEFKRNPHAHIMLNYRVDWEIFPAFVKGLESLWSNGFAHFEMIKNQKSAAAYLMKALGYITKAAAGSDQGVIYGNRYGISKNARAPGWVTARNYAWHIAGQLIEMQRLKQRRELKPLEQQRDSIKTALEAADKEAKPRLKNALKKVREKITEKKGAVFFGRNRVVCKDEKAANQFLSWLKKMGWIGLDKPLSLYADILRRKAEKLKSDYSQWYAECVEGWFERLDFNDNLEPVL